MSEIKPVYLRISKFHELEVCHGSIEGATLYYHSADYEALQKNCAKLLDEQDREYNKKTNELINRHIAQVEALQKENERLLLTIQAMNVGQRVLQGAIQASSMTDSEWRDKYMREVEGLNNEGDPIGGDPPSGLHHQVDALKSENEALQATNANVLASLGRRYRDIIELRRVVAAQAKRIDELEEKLKYRTNTAC